MRRLTIAILAALFGLGSAWAVVLTAATHAGAPVRSGILAAGALPALADNDDHDHGDRHHHRRRGFIVNGIFYPCIGRGDDDDQGDEDDQGCARYAGYIPPGYPDAYRYPVYRGFRPLSALAYYFLGRIFHWGAGPYPYGYPNYPYAYPPGSPHSCINPAGHVRGWCRHGHGHVSRHSTSLPEA